MTFITASRPHSPSRLSATGLETAKWAALALMTVNHLLLALPQPWAMAGFIAGRPCVALFSTVMLLRLAEGGADRAGRAFGRLLLWGAAAQGPYWLLSHNLGVRLDVLFSLAAGAGLIWLLRTDRPRLAALAALALLALDPWLDGGAALPLAMAGGWLLVERRRPWLAVALIPAASVAHNLLATPGLWPAALAVLAAPLVLLVQVRLPRLPGWAFYAYYPAHLALIWLVLGAYR